MEGVKGQKKGEMVVAQKWLTEYFKQFLFYVFCVEFPFVRSFSLQNTLVWLGI